MSPDGRIEPPMGSPWVGCNLDCLAGACRLKQNISQPRSISAMQVEGLAEHPGLVPAARMQRAQAIILNLADIEDSLVAAR